MIGIPNDAEVRPDGSEPVILCDLANDEMVGLVKREKAPILLVGGEDVSALRESPCKT